MFLLDFCKQCTSIRRTLPPKLKRNKIEDLSWVGFVWVFFVIQALLNSSFHFFLSEMLISWYHLEFVFLYLGT